MKILIVEDETVVARRLQRLVGEIMAGRQVQLSLEQSLQEAIESLSERPVDLLLLDLNLAGQDGFEILAQAVAGPQQTIVVSANTDRALEAFDHGVLDFVPKPFTRDRLARAMARLDDSGPGRNPARFLSVRGGRGLELIDVTRLRGIHGAGDYSELELDDGRRVLHNKTLDQLQRLLPDRFVRIHRSHIVPIELITYLRSLPGSRYVAEMDNGTQLPVGRTRIPALRQLIR